MQLYVLLAALLPSLCAASPIKNRRAGGPGFVPIPANCSVSNPLPHASAHPGNGTVSGWLPSEAFSAVHQIYEFYLPPPPTEPLSTQWLGCLEQCNGLDGCVSALLAYNAPTPKGYYGTAGGALEIGCFMFNTTLTPRDFVRAPPGQYVNETAGNIHCPPS